MMQHYDMMIGKPSIGCTRKNSNEFDSSLAGTIVEEKVLKVFSEMEKRVSTEDMTRIHETYELARKAHAEHKRKTGEPYIINPTAEWMEHVLTYKAKGFLKRYFAKQEKPTFHFCPNCHPIPGEEVVGFKEADGTITVHKRNCPIAIGLASQQGDSIVSVALVGCTNQQFFEDGLAKSVPPAAEIGTKQGARWLLYYHQKGGQLQLSERDIQRLQKLAGETSVDKSKR